MSRRTILSGLLLVLAACSGAQGVANLPTRAALNPGGAANVEIAFRAQDELPTRAVLPTALPTPQPLNFWQAVTGTLSSLDEIDQWQFSAQQGDNIGLRSIGRGIAVSLALVDGAGTVLARGSSIEFVIPAAGSYIVRVQLTEAGAGEYELGLRFTDRPNPAEAAFTAVPQVVGVPTPTPAFADLGTFAGTLAAGDALTGVFEAASQRFVHTFAGSAGQYAIIRAERVSGEVDPIISLYSPAGEWLAVDDNSGGERAALLNNIRLPLDGEYSVQVSGDGLPGEYRILLEILPKPAPVTPTIVVPPSAMPRPQLLRPTFAPGPSDTRLQDHTPVLGNLTRPGLFNRFTITAQASEIISVGVRPAVGSSFQPQIEIFGPAGDLVAMATADTSNAGGDALITGLWVGSTGVYTVFVTAQDSESTGEYVIAFGRGFSYEDVLRGEPVQEQFNSGAVARRGLRDVWELFLNAGDVISVTATAAEGSGLDPLLTMVAPDGSLVAIDDNSGGNGGAHIAAARTPQDGVYRLEVAASGSVTSGPYTLVWRHVEHGPPATPPPARTLIMSVDDFASERNYGFFPFQGRAGERVFISVIAQPGVELDPVAVLLDPNGEVIAEGDDGPNDLNARFIVDLPVDGTYVVRVNGYGASMGGFNLTVERLIAR